MRHGANTTIVGRKAERLAAAAQELERAAGNGTKCLAAPGDVRQFETLVDAVNKVRRARLCLLTCACTCAYALAVRCSSNPNFLGAAPGSEAVADS